MFSVCRRVKTDVRRRTVCHSSFDAAGPGPSRRQLESSRAVLWPQIQRYTLLRPVANSPQQRPPNTNSNNGHNTTVFLAESYPTLPVALTREEVRRVPGEISAAVLPGEALPAKGMLSQQSPSRLRCYVACNRRDTHSPLAPPRQLSSPRSLTLGRRRRPACVVPLPRGSNCFPRGPRNLGQPAWNPLSVSVLPRYIAVAGEHVWTKTGVGISCKGGVSRGFIPADSLHYG